VLHSLPAAPAAPPWLLLVPAASPAQRSAGAHPARWLKIFGHCLPVDAALVVPAQLQDACLVRDKHVADCAAGSRWGKQLREAALLLMSHLLGELQVGPLHELSHQLQ